jgi:molecular chaperone DnaK
MGRVIGIDLGTTNSVTAYSAVGTTVLANAEGDDLTPSCVLIDGSVDAGKPLVGRAAKALQVQYPRSTVVSVKRLIGRDFEEPDVARFRESSRYAYLIESDPGDPGAIRIPFKGGSRSPEELSSYILKKVSADAASRLEAPVTHAVVTVPAYFSDRQKHATRKACELAGLQVLRLLPEPTAAALSFDRVEKADDQARTYLVFDLGGGTFDVSLLSGVSGQFMEVAKGGDMWLGGDDIDALLRDHVLARSASALGRESIAPLIEALSDLDRLRFQSELTEACERAKKTLSLELSALVDVFGTLKDERGGLVDIEVTVTRAEFDGLLEPIAQRLVTLTSAVLSDAHFEPEMIDTVLMVGGSSLIPILQQSLRERFGQGKVAVHPRPMLAIAEGAALLAKRLGSGASAEESDINLMHSSSHAYALQLALGGLEPLVERNAPLPARSTRTLHFASTKQNLARLRIFNLVDGSAEVIGECWLHASNSRPFDLPQPDKVRSRKSGTPVAVAMEFEVDEDNVIRMRAWPEGQPDSPIEATIARGGAEVPLFAQLEHTLSTIAGRLGLEITLESYLSLSRIVCDSIRATATATTEADRREARLRSVRQIQTLSVLSLATKHAPVREWALATIIMNEYPGLVPADERSAFAEATARFERELRSLEDASGIHMAMEDVRQHMVGSDSMDLGCEALSIAYFQAADFPGDARRIRERLSDYSAALAKGEAQAAARHEDALMRIMEGYESTYSQASLRFERDVVVAR